MQRLCEMMTDEKRMREMIFVESSESSGLGSAIVYQDSKTEIINNDKRASRF